MPNEPLNVRSIFDRALEFTSDAERTAYLNDVCAGAPEIRQQVDALLNAYLVAGSFLESPPPGLTAVADGTQLSEQPGSLVGPYKLLEQIGEGGMGVVFMAEQQEPVRRKVALKLIKPGMDTRQVIARFEAERQALAVMDHPSIARVLDAGATSSGHPYFVMELVHGVPITTYCDENSLTVRERLELFASLCQAVQHAHTKGIVHRDIKPSNVLITRQDGRPAVKVIDFGVAKAMGQQLTEKTLFTNFAQMIGTPLYMSPEQAEQSGVDIDTRSDIYSLGVLLYELLTGSTPVDAEQLKQAAFDEIRRIIREDEPPTPSARISGSHTLPAIAARRHIEPARLEKLVRGELDWIVMKALEKDRNRRYETANAFAADLLHYLNDEQVQACPPSAKYRLGKFARRNRVAITTAATVAAALMVGTVVSTWQAIRAETARAAEAEQRAIAESARAAEVTHRKVADAERAEAERQRELAEANFKRARETVDEYFTLVSESKLLNVPGLQPLRKELLDAALNFYKKTAAVRTSDPSILADMAAAYMRVAQIDYMVGRNDDSVAALASALDAVDRLRRDYPTETERYRSAAGFWKGARETELVSETPTDPIAAFKTLQRAIKTWQELVDQDPQHAAFRSDLASLCYLTGLMMADINERESLRYHERSKALLEKLVVDQPDIPEHQADLARVEHGMVGKLRRAGRNAEAEAANRHSQELREELVARFPDVPQHRAELARILSARASTIAPYEPAEAEKMFQRSIDLTLAVLHEWPELTVHYELLFGVIREWATYASTTDRPGLREQLEKTIEDLAALALSLPYGAHLPKALTTATRSVTQATPIAQRPTYLRQDIARYEKLASVHPGVAEYRRELARSHNLLGILLRNAGQNDESAVELQTAQELWHKQPDPAVEQAKKKAEAEPKNGHHWHALLVAYYNAGDWEQCLWAIKKKQEVFGASAWEWFHQAMAHWQLDHRDEALGWYHKSISWMNEWSERRLRPVQAEAAFLLELLDPVDLVDRAKQLEQQALAQEKQGQTAEAKHGYLEAIDVYRNLIAVFPAVASYRRTLFGLLFKADAPREMVAEAIASYPEDADELNLFAWQLAADPRIAPLQAQTAVALAQRGVALKPEYAALVNTLGVAHYRAGNWAQAVEWLNKSMELRKGGDSIDWFFLAMAHWQLGEKNEARDWQARAIQWMDKHGSTNEELKRFRTEAGALLQDESATTEQESGKKAEGTP